MAIAPTVTDAIGVKIWWIVTVKNSVPGAVILLPFGVQPWGWDPSCFADFKNLIGKVFHTNECILNPDNRYAAFELRLKPRKLDQVEWLQGGPQVGLVIQTCNLTSTANVPLAFVNTWNLSFSADANGVTGALAVAAPPVLRLSRKPSEVVMSEVISTNQKPRK